MTTRPVAESSMRQPPTSRREVRCPQCNRFFFEVEIDLPEGMPAGAIWAKRIKCVHCRQWVQGVLLMEGPVVGVK
jgi:hypothetical protein